MLIDCFSRSLTIFFIIVLVPSSSRRFCSGQNEHAINHESCSNCSIQEEKYKVIINTSETIASLHRFWRSTGLCPPDPHQESYKFFSTKDFNLNLIHIGALPNRGITHVRIHWLLSLVKVKIKTDFSMFYDFSKLDDLVHKMWLNNLYLGFELMGNPSGIFNNFENSTQIHQWKDMVKSLAVHYLNLYGTKYVSKWRFETWNEPDHHDFDGLNFTIQGFLNYYDACSEGLKSANKLLKLGGPGGSCHESPKSPMCWALLKHCVSGKNFFTNETGVRIDFISFHKKGNGSSEEILRGEIETIDYIRTKFPSLFHLPIYNDEADPIKGWSSCKLWRADASYAAIVVKVIAQHINYYVVNNNRNMKKANFHLLSNDNGFLSYFPCQFTERTLLARFQINNTVPPHVQFVRKPVYAVMGLLSRTCDKLLDLKIINSDGKEEGSMAFGAFATTCKNDRNQITIILYNSDDENYSLGKARVRIDLYHQYFNNSDIRWAIHQVNNIQSNPFNIWRKMGHPAFPTYTEFKYIKEQEEPYLDVFKVGKFPEKIDIELLKPGVSVIEICTKKSSPLMVKHLRVWKTSENSVQIVWKDIENRCIFTYIIQYSYSIDGPFEILNDKLVNFPSFWHACMETSYNCTLKGFYRVQVMNYWKEFGPYTDPVKCCHNLID